MLLSANSLDGRIAEEAKDPSRVVPKAIANATTFTYVIGFLFNLVLVLCMGDPVELVNSASGQPVSSSISARSLHDILTLSSPHRSPNCSSTPWAAPRPSSSPSADSSS